MIRWEARRLLPVAGFVVKSRNTQVCSVMRRHEGKITSMQEAFQWDAQRCYGKSMHSLICTKRELRPDANEERDGDFWVDTKMMLAIFAHWALCKKQSHLRRNVRAFLEAFLITCVPLDAVQSLLQIIEEGDLEVCRRGGIDSGEPCLCLASVFEDPAFADDGAAVSQRTILARIVALAAIWEKCPAAAIILGRFYERLGRCIDAHRDDWGDFDVLKNPEFSLANGPAGKRRRVSVQLRVAAVETAVQDGVASKPSTVLRTMGLASPAAGILWCDKTLMELQATSRLSNQFPGVVSFVFDAAQIGKPHKDILLAAQHSEPGNIDIVLPPKDNREYGL